MKLNKIFAIALAALTLTACSDDDDADVNSKAGVSVSMLDPTLTVGENSEYFNVPLQVTGETNGQVIVTLEVKAGPADPNNATNPTIPAEEGTHYYVTSKTIHIPAGEVNFGVEVRNEWVKGLIDEDKVFTISIVKAQGATVGAVKDCVVTIANVDDAYTAMLGTWTLTANDWYDDPVTDNLSFETPDPADEDYGSLLMGYGLFGYSFLYIPMTYDYNKATSTVEMTIPVHADACDALLNFGSYVGYIVTASSAPSLWGTDIPLTVSEDMDEITAAPNSTLFLMTINNATGSVQGYFDKLTNIHMEKE